MKIQDKIRSLRMERGWSQETMAAKLEMAVTTYSNIERGITDIQASRLEQIANVFGISLVDLISFGENGITCVAGDNSQRHQHIYQHFHTQTLIYSQEATALELQKLQLFNEQKDKEIENLKEQISQLKEINALLKKNA